MDSLVSGRKKPTIALLIVDMINDLEFEDGEELYKQMLPAAKQIAKLKKLAEEYTVPVIYVNDNYGRWQSDFRQIVEHCMKRDVRGREIAHLLKPAAKDYFVLKPQFSGFFNTPLDMLLRHLDVRTLIITGVAGNMCVHFTANDAYMRGYKLFVPRDCTASNSTDSNLEALRIMEKVLHADISPIEDFNMNRMLTEAEVYYMDTE